VRALRCDVTYSTVREIGYDFLREAISMDPQRGGRIVNLNWLMLPPQSSRSDRDAICLRGRNFAIVDEADSVLIDFARSPISISEPSDEPHRPEVYKIADAAARSLVKGVHFTVDEAKKEVELTSEGEQVAASLRSRHRELDMIKLEWQELLKDAIKANHLLFRDRDYIVQEDEVVLVDQITGRRMTGVRLGQHTHQALEAKEGITIKPTMMVVRSINVQRLFEPYKRLAGMTGTAWDSRREFKSVYKMSVSIIPTNKPLRRNWLPDQIFATEEEKWDAVVKDIAERHARGQPILVGTRSVNKSEILHERLKALNIPHHVLNAREHAKEAEVIATAGEKGSVTVSTRMAGRGVDIKLGPGVVELGGLHILGTERHELRRIDYQLGGRCGRQGDPGSIQYFASLEDDVLRVIPEKPRPCGRPSSSAKNSMSACKRFSSPTSDRGRTPPRDGSGESRGSGMARLVLVLVVLVGVSTGLAGLSAVCTASSTQKKLPYRVKTRHYVVRTDVNREYAEEIADYMEILYAAYSRVFRNIRPNYTTRLPVTILKNAADYKKAVGEKMSWSRGVYRGRYLGIMTYLGNSGPETVRSILRHEGFHQFFEKFIGYGATWVNEGLAVFFQHAIVEGDKLYFGTVGKGTLDRVRKAYENDTALSLEELLTVTGSGWSMNMSAKDRPPQYQQAHLLVHFLVLGHEGRNKDCLDKYLMLLKKGTYGRDALIQAFGTDFRKFEEKWKEYVLSLEPYVPHTCTVNMVKIARLLPAKTAARDGGIRTIEELRDILLAETENEEKKQAIREMFICPNQKGKRKKLTYALEPSGGKYPDVICTNHGKYRLRATIVPLEKKGAFRIDMRQERK